MTVFYIPIMFWQVYVRSLNFYSIKLLPWIILFGASIASTWSPLSHVSALYRYYEYYGLVYLINMNRHDLFSVYKILISENYRDILSYSPTPGQQVSMVLWNITITVWCLCEIVKFLLITVVITTYFFWGHNHVYLIDIITGECAIPILGILRFGVCHRY